jgi:anthocyanidin reductase
MVHVGDLCRAKIFVAEEEAASGRYICCSLDSTAAELATFLAAKYPQYNVKTDRCVRTPDSSRVTANSEAHALTSPKCLFIIIFRFGGRPKKPRVCMSSAKLVGEGFEFRYRTLDEIYDDVVDYGRALGILKY